MMIKPNLIYLNASEKDNTLLPEVLANPFFRDTPSEIVALAEHLPWYTSFPKRERKTELQGLIRENSEKRLKDFLTDLPQSLRENVRTELLEGRYPKTLINHAMKRDCEMIVKQSPPSHTAKANNPAYIGDNDLKLARQSEVSLFLVRNRIQKDGHILAAVAPSLEDPRQNRICRRILGYAADLAQAFGLQLHAVHAWYLIGEEMVRGHVPEEDYKQIMAHRQQQGQEALESLLKDFPRAERHLLYGHPTPIIHDLCEKLKPEILVMGSVAHSGALAHVIGSTAESILRNENRSCLIVKN